MIVKKCFSLLLDTISKHIIVFKFLVPSDSADVRLNSTCCSAFSLPVLIGMATNILERTLYPGRALIIGKFMCCLFVPRRRSVNLWPGREGSSVSSPIFVQRMECSPLRHFAAIHGDGDNCSFISRSGTVCVSTMGFCMGPRPHSHSEDPFWH